MTKQEFLTAKIGDLISHKERGVFVVSAIKESTLAGVRLLDIQMSDCGNWEFIWPKTKKPTLAERIALALFTSGSGNQADRLDLQMKDGGCGGGGWGMSNAAKCIQEIIDEYQTVNAQK